MNTKKRKSLNDALAQQFVYGSQPEEVKPEIEVEPVTPVAVMPVAEGKGKSKGKVVVEPEPVTSVDVTPVAGDEVIVVPQPKVQKKSKTSAKTKKKESRVSDRLQPVEREATVRITVDLPESLHKRLSIYCATSGNKKAEVVRVLLDEFLSEQGIKES